MLPLCTYFSRHFVSVFSKNHDHCPTARQGTCLIVIQLGQITSNQFSTIMTKSCRTSQVNLIMNQMGQIVQLTNTRAMRISQLNLMVNQTGWIVQLTQTRVLRITPLEISFPEI